MRAGGKRVLGIGKQVLNSKANVLWLLLLTRSAQKSRIHAKGFLSEPRGDLHLRLFIYLPAGF